MSITLDWNACKVYINKAKVEELEWVENWIKHWFEEFDVDKREIVYHATDSDLRDMLEDIKTRKEKLL